MNLLVLGNLPTTGEYYEPADRSLGNAGRALRPSTVPDGWTERGTGMWREWSHPDLTLPEAGWKIHVSARPKRLQHVLDTVAEVCFAAGVPFKHLASDRSYMAAHHKHAPAPQAGKFCTVYPPDVPTARRLLDELTQRLKGEEGPYILTDRRYGDTGVVFYRYGAFRPIVRVRADGTTEHLVRNGRGEPVPDRRTVQFVLPEGVTDPFTEEAPADLAAAAADGVRIGDFRVVAPLARSNAGGAYRGLDPDGNPVFVKEARAHNGVHWDGSTAQMRLRHEYEVLRDLHEKVPGVAPRPIAYVREWEHEFMVTELVPGRKLSQQLAVISPYGEPSTEADYLDYFALCRRVNTQLSEILRRLHGAGYRFGDLNPNNILITDDGDIRLVDFEACTRLDGPPRYMGALGFTPIDPEQHAGVAVDEYGHAAVMLALLFPTGPFAERCPATLAHLRADLDRLAARDTGSEKTRVPDDLWRAATRHLTGEGVTLSSLVDPDAPPLPTPEEVEADPRGHLRWLFDGLRRDLIAVADPDDPYRIFPSVPRGYGANTHCVAYGTAGVLHALHHADAPVDDRVVTRLRDHVREDGDLLPPGLHFGTAGIGWVLAELGHTEFASSLVHAAGRHPLVTRTATWGGGAAGVGCAHLALYGTTRAQAHLDEAVRLGDALCDVEDLTPMLGPRDARGLLHGRAGVALFLHHLWRATDDKRYLRHGAAVLHAELDRAVERRGDLLGFNDDARTTRVMPYLGIGSAGVGHVLTRYVRAGADERFAEALPRVFGYASRWNCVYPGLYEGLAGMAFAWADHADVAGDPDAARTAVDLARGLFKQVTPAAGGRIRVLGELYHRFSTELFSGSAGVLLALDRILHGPKGQFFTLTDLLSDSAPKTGTPSGDGQNVEPDAEGGGST